MINSQAYSEVYEILKHMDKEVVMKIPVEILENIKNKKDLNYKSKINKEDIFNPNNVLPETIAILNWIDVNFWITKDKKENILKKVRKKEFEENKLKKEKYNSNDIFKKLNKNKNNNKISENNTNATLVQYKNSFFTRLKNFIFKMLHINKKTN